MHIAIGVVGLAALIYTGLPVAVYQWTTSRNIKARVVTTWSRNDSYYASVVYPDSRTHNLQIRDSFWWFIWNASDRFALLKKNEGREVTMRPVGLRIPFISWFPNPVRVCDSTECK